MTTQKRARTGSPASDGIDELRAVAFEGSDLANVERCRDYQHRSARTLTSLQLTHPTRRNPLSNLNIRAGSRWTDPDHFKRPPIDAFQGRETHVVERSLKREV